MAPNMKGKDNSDPSIPPPIDEDSETTPLAYGHEYGSLSAGIATPPSSSRSNTRKTYDGQHRRTPSKMSDQGSHVLLKTQTTMLQDARTFAEGSIPHSVAIGTVIGIICGVAAFVYYVVLFWVLKFVWHTLPETIVVGKWPEWCYVLWIPLVGFTMAIGVGLTVIFMGEPGDLPSTIKCVHDQAYVAMDHVMPMVAASQFSIVGGGSLGPEAPLVAICAALAGFISRSVFRVENRNLMRKHTLMGMAGALAAFFGCPVGGSLFALEVNSRFGVEYFEHVMEAIYSGVICLAVFRQLANLPIEPIWQINMEKLGHTTALEVLYGIFIGLLGAGVAFIFANFHWKIMELFQRLDLLRNERAVYRSLLGAIVVVGLGMLIPHTMFWGEMEIQTIATMSPADTLEHIWPTYGLTHFEIDRAWKALLVGLAKIVAISFTVAGGYRGGFIFPLMATGAALGRVVYSIMPFIPVQICVLGMAAGINVGITRTALATTLILSYLSGEQNTIAPLVASSLISLFATGYMPFIKSQVLRSDLDCLFDEEEDWDHPQHPDGPFVSIPKPEHRHRRSVSNMSDPSIV